MLMFSFVLVAGMVSAQSCAKKCAKTCGSKAKTANVETTTNADDTQVASALAQAEIAAEANENIEKRVCGTSGKVSFYQKNVCSTSGKVSYDEVSYCTKSKAFGSVASASAEADIAPMDAAAPAPAAKSAKKACSKSCKKTCTAKKEQ